MRSTWSGEVAGEVVATSSQPARRQTTRSEGRAGPVSKVLNEWPATHAAGEQPERVLQQGCCLRFTLDQHRCLRAVVDALQHCGQQSHQGIAVDGRRRGVGLGGRPRNRFEDALAGRWRGPIEHAGREQLGGREGVEGRLGGHHDAHPVAAGPGEVVAAEWETADHHRCSPDVHEGPARRGHRYGCDVGKGDGRAEGVAAGVEQRLEAGGRCDDAIAAAAVEVLLRPSVPELFELEDGAAAGAHRWSWPREMTPRPSRMESSGSSTRRGSTVG